MDPTPDELRSFTTVGSVLAWVPFIGAAIDAFLYFMGITRDEPVRVLAVTSEAMLQSTMDSVTYTVGDDTFGLAPRRP